MTKTRKTRAELDLEYIARLEALRDFIVRTPTEALPTDHDLGLMFNTSAYSCHRARHMIATGCTAREAMAAVRLKSTKIKIPKYQVSHASEAMAGSQSLALLTQSWCAA